MLVSCVMPTKDRRAFIGAAIRCFLDQTYEDRELIIIDDGQEAIQDLIGLRVHPSDPDSRIRYIKSTPYATLGEKRNACCAAARGEVICHFDDDDWSDPERIADQVGRLKKSGKPVTGYGTLLFWDVVAQQPKRYRASIKNYICGTTFCYLRRFWEKHRFAARQKASDNAFIYPVLDQVDASTETRYVVARIHDQHTSEKGGITEVVSRDLIPAGFWKNEELRLAS